jgi:hypothetical protein
MIKPEQLFDIIQENQRLSRIVAASVKTASKSNDK